MFPITTFFILNLQPLSQNRNRFDCARIMNNKCPHPVYHCYTDMVCSGTLFWGLARDPLGENERKGGNQRECFSLSVLLRPPSLGVGWRARFSKVLLWQTRATRPRPPWRFHAPRKSTTPMKNTHFKHVSFQLRMISWNPLLLTGMHKGSACVIHLQTENGSEFMCTV